MSPLSTTLRPGRGGPEHLVRRDDAVVLERDRLAGLQQPARRPDGHAERVRRLDVEAARPRVLDQREAERLDRVGDREGDEVVVAALEHVAGRQLHQLERVGQLAEDPPQRAEELLQAGRPVDRQRQLAAAERERLQHPGQAEVVVGVEVRDEHLAQLDEADRGAQHLPLRALAAVEQQPLAAAAQRAAPRGRAGPSGPSPRCRRRRGRDPRLGV